MKNIFAKVNQFEGTHYELGKFQSELILQTDYLNRMRVFIKNENDTDVDIDDIKRMIMKFAPQIWDELKGLSDGLQLSMHDTLLRFSGFFYEQKSGCSIIMDQNYMVRNYDQHPGAYDSTITLYKPTDGGFASIGPNMIITGRTDGMNEHGLVVGYNFVTVKNRKSGFTCNMIARILLEQCKTIEDAIVILKTIPHRSSFNYCLLDSTGKYCIVEVSATHVDVRYDNTCTNHFVLQTAHNHKLTKKSESRLELMNEVFSKDSDVRSVYKAMNDDSLGIYAHDYKHNDGTLHTAVYISDLVASYSYGFNRLPVSIDFGKWLNGSRLNLSKIKGIGVKDIKYLNEV